MRMSKCYCAAVGLQWLHVLASIACAGKQPSAELPAPMSEAAAAAADHPGHADRNLITSSEIQEGMLTAYDVVQFRRPAWITPRRFSTTGRLETPDVYIDGVRYGSCETLKSIKTSVVAELRFLDVAAATMRFGSAAANGVILVTLRR